MSSSFVVRTHTTAPRERCFALLSDAPAWARWAGPAVPGARWHPTTPAGGKGAVRLVGRGPLTVQERVVVHDPPRAFSYVLLSGARLHGYRADVRLDRADDGGTGIEWRGCVASPVPGLELALLPVFRLLVTDFASRLARAAEA